MTAIPQCRIAVSGLCTNTRRSSRGALHAKSHIAGGACNDGPQSASWTEVRLSWEMILCRRYLSQVGIRQTAEQHISILS